MTDCDIVRASSIVMDLGSFNRSCARSFVGTVIPSLGVASHPGFVHFKCGGSERGLCCFAARGKKIFAKKASVRATVEMEQGIFL